MARKGEMTKQERRRLAEMLCRHLDGLGAVKVCEHTYTTTSLAGETVWGYVLETPLGKMDVTFSTHAVYLHCRFHEPERAAGRLAAEMNEYSGKYNEYAFGLKAEEAFDIFKRHLSRPFQAVAA